MRKNVKKAGWVSVVRWLVSLAGLGVFLYFSGSLAGFASWKELSIFYFDGLYLAWLVIAVLLVLYLAGAEKDFVRGFRIVFSRVRGVSRMELQRVARAFGCVEKAAAVSGIAGVAMGAIDLSLHLYRDMSPESIGMCLAALFIYVLYPALLVLFLIPMRVRLDRMAISYMEDPENPEEETAEAEEQRVYFRLRSMGLTDREAEVARLAGSGRSNAEIGKELYISVATVKKHMTHILEKAECGDREMLAAKVKKM